MLPAKRTKLSWLVVVLGSFLGLWVLVSFVTVERGSYPSGEVPQFLVHAGTGLLGLCLIVASNVALRRRRLAGMIFLACIPFVAFCMTYPFAGYLVWHADGNGVFESPFPATAAYLALLFFAPFVVLFFNLPRRKLLRYLFPISACLAWIPFGLNHWAWSMLPGLTGWSIFLLLFAMFWLGTYQRDWPPLLQPGANLGHSIRYVVFLGVLLGLVFWADGRATLIGVSLLCLIIFPGEPRRRKRIYAVVAMGSFLAITAALRLETYVFRHRSERLLADVKGLETRKTTYSEAQRVLQKWPELRLWPPEHDKNKCKFDIILGHVSPSFTDWALGFFGRRTGFVQAQISVEKGVVWGRYFAVHLETPSQGWPAHALFGAFDTVSRSYDLSWDGLNGLIIQTLIHPDYLLEQRQANFNADTPAALIVASAMSVHETQYADPAVVRHLEEFDFSGITRWFACRNVAELMPTAWAEYQSDQPRALAAVNQLKCTPDKVETQARDAELAAVVEVSGNWTDSFRGENHAVAMVRMVEPLRGDPNWKIDQTRDLWLSTWALADTSTGRALTLPQGKRFILLYFFNGRMPAAEEFPYPCGVIPWSQENMVLVQRGIAKDTRANDPGPYVW